MNQPLVSFFASTSTRFRRIFISRARRLWRGCSFRPGWEDAEKRKFFRSKGEHVYGAKDGSYLSRCRNDPEEEARRFRWRRRRVVSRNAAAVANLDPPRFRFISLSVVLSFCFPAAHLWYPFFSYTFVKSNDAAERVPTTRNHYFLFVRILLSWEITVVKHCGRL